MSGLEIVGLVLGAIPLLVETIKGCQKISKSVHLFHEINVEFARWDHTLKYHQESFRNIMRQLLKPLIRDEDKLNDLLSDPRGSCWENEGISEPLQKIMGEMYEHFINCIRDFHDVITQLNNRLKLHLTPKVHSKMPILSLFRSHSKNTAQSQISKIKFIMGEATRNRLIEELETLDCRLRQIASDKMLSIRQRTSEPRSLPYNTALSGAWTCCCHIQRTLTMAGAGPHFAKLLIDSSGVIEATVHRPPNDHTSAPLRSTLEKGKGIDIPVKSVREEPDLPCAFDDLQTITLDQILRIEKLLPTRRQRFSLSFYLVSSFILLFETPGLFIKWQKSDVVFFKDKENRNKFHLDRPYSNTQQTLLEDITIANSDNLNRLYLLELLGIVLLELCFGKPLEEHSIRKQWPVGDNDLQKHKLDVLAAREWSEHVKDEAGFNFDEAIRWCLRECRDVSPGEWRREMVQHVVEPLRTCIGATFECF